MAAVKANTQLANGVTLTAGAGNTTSSAADLTVKYGAVVNVKLTNGGTGPTIAAQVQVQVSEDNSKWYNYGPALIGDTANSAVRSWTIVIDAAVQYVRTVAGSNTGQAVTLDADCSVISSI